MSFIEDNINKIINADCLDILKIIPNSSIDLVVTDPPYLLKNTKTGSKSKFSQRFQKVNDEISEIDQKYFDEACRKIEAAGKQLRLFGG